MALIVGLMFLPMCTGCLARQVTRDGVQMRQALLEMYTDQVMDNLVRAHNNMPFVQVTYSDVTVQDNDELNATLNGSHTLSEDLVPAVTRNFVRMFGWQAGGTRSRTMSFVANPITDQNDIYDAYLEFARDPARFVVSCNDPGCAAHIVRKHKKVYYWVPVDAGKDFLDLTMATTFKRGAESAPPTAYEVTILSAKATLTNLDPKTNIPKDPKLPGDLRFADLTFSSELLNGDATMVAKLKDGRTFKIDLIRATTRIKEGKKENVDPGDPTDVLTTKPWSPKAKGYTELDLLGAKARIYSHDYPPDAPVAAPRTLQRIRADVNFIRNRQTQIRR